MGKLTRRVYKETTTEIEIGRDELLSLLRKAGYKIVDYAVISVHVPSGANWSGQAVEIDSDAPLLVSFSAKSEETEED